MSRNILALNAPNAGALGSLLRNVASLTDGLAELRLQATHTGPEQLVRRFDDLLVIANALLAVVEDVVAERHLKAVMHDVAGHA